MNNLIKKIAKYTILFLTLYVCSIIVVKFFVLAGASYTNLSNTAFVGALLAFIILLILNRIHQKKQSVTMEEKMKSDN